MKAKREMARKLCEHLNQNFMPTSDVAWKRWDDAAQAVLDMAGQDAPEETPLDYVEACATRTSLDPVSGGHVLNLTMTVPQTVRHHRTPGSQARALERLMSLATAPGHSMRISVVSNARTVAEFSRMEPDGTMRELAPLEGTW